MPVSRSLARLTSGLNLARGVPQLSCYAHINGLGLEVVEKKGFLETEDQF
jgi:hypothetical protein